MATIDDLKARQLQLGAQLVALDAQIKVLLSERESARREAKSVAEAIADEEITIERLTPQPIPVKRPRITPGELQNTIYSERNNPAMLHLAADMILAQMRKLTRDAKKGILPRDPKQPRAEVQAAKARREALDKQLKF